MVSSGQSAPAARPPASESRLRRSIHGVRVQLALLVVLGAIPVALAIVLQMRGERDMAIRYEQNKLRYVVAEIADQQGHVADLAEQLLRSLSTDPAILSRANPLCDAALVHGLSGRQDHLTNVYVLNLEGDVVCSALQTATPYPWDKLAAFQAALKAPGLVIGEVMKGPTSHRPILPVFLAVRDPSGKVQSVLLAGLDLTWLADVPQRAGFPHSAVIGLLDEHDRVAFLDPDAAHLLGKSVADRPVVQAIHASGKRGMFDGPGLEGAARCVAFDRFGEHTGNGLTVWLSVDRAAMIAAVPPTSFALGITTLVLFGLLLTVIWLASDRLILRPVEQLGAAFRRLGTGDLTTRVGADLAKGELGDLARVFDDTVVALAAMRESERANKAMKVLLAVKGARPVRDDEAALVDTLAQRIVAAGDYPLVWIGHADHDNGKQLLPISLHGVAADAVRGHVASPTADELGDAPLRAIREARVVTTGVPSESDTPAQWPEIARMFGIASTIAIPLRDSAGAVAGSLAIYSRDPNAFGELESRLLADAGDDIIAKIEALRDRIARQKAQEALAASESTLARAEELGLAGSWLLDLKTRVLWPSAGLLHIAGLEAHEFPGTLPGLMGFVHPDDREWVQRAFLHAVEVGGEYDVRHRILTKSGEVRHVHARSVTQPNDRGEPTQSIGTVLDITDEVATRVALRERVKESNCLHRVFRDTERSAVPLPQMLRTVVEYLPPGWLHDADACARIRLGDETYATANFAETAWMQSAPFVVGGQTGDVTVAYLHRHEPQEQGVFLREERDLIDAIAKRIADMLAMRAADERLRESEALYSAIVNQARDAIATVDMGTGLFAEFNAASHTMLGYTRDEFARLGPRDLDDAPTPDVIQSQIVMMMQPEGATIETKARARDGSLRNIRVSGQPIRVGGKSYLAATWSDLTEAKRAEAELRRMTADQRMLATAIRAILFGEDQLALVQTICDVIVQERGYRLAWFGVPEHDGAKRVAVVAQAGKAADYLKALAITWADEPLGQGPTGTAVRERRHVVVQNVATDLKLAPWRASAAKHGIGSSIAIPLFDVQGEVLGVLTVYAAEPHAFLEGEITLLRSLADSLAFGIRSLRDREAREAAELENSKLSLAIDQSPNPVIVTDLQGRIEYINPAFTASTGYTREEILHKNPRFLKSGLTPERVYGEMWAWLRAGEVWRGEFTNRRKDGTVFSERATIVPLRNADGAICNYVAIKEDVSALKASEEKLRKLSLAVEQSPASIAITDLNGDIEYVNPAFVRHTGYTMDELRGGNPRVLQSGKTPRATYGAMWAALTAGKVWQGEFVNKRKDGTEYTERATLAPIRDDAGKITHYVAIKDDITERKHLDAELDEHRHHLEELVDTRTAQLREAQARAEAANMAKSAFLANMSHEIRTPLNAIIGLTHLMTHQVEIPEQVERLRKIDGSARHLLAIINDILDLSKVEAGKLRLENVDFAVADLVDGVRDSLTEQARAKGLTLEFEVAEALPARLNGDSLRLTQVLLNLGSNAVKFTSHGEVIVRMMADTADAGPLRVRFEVQDTGIGLSQEQTERIFQPFEQADVSTTRKFGGTGLGLAISRRLVELLGGTLGVTSAPGQGSTFWFTLPLHAAGTLRVGQPKRTSHGLPPVVRVGRKAASVVLLLVEDDLINQEVATELLASRGFVVEVAENGQIALEKAQRTRYDAVLMDVQMPVMDGLTATRELRKRVAYEQTPILAMTASVFAEDKEACLAAGMNDFVAKPINPQTFFATLCEWTGVDLEPRPRRRATGMTGVGKPRPRLSAIAGLDTDAGLRVVQGRWETYERLLRKFSTERADDVTRLREHIVAGRWQEAQRTVHTLKGVAATLGATAVGAAALRLETLLQLGADAPPTFAEPLQELSETHGALVRALAEALPDSIAPVAAVVDWPAAGQMLAQLQKLLADDDVRALQTFRTDAPMLRAALGPAFDALARDVESFEFDDALTRVRALFAEIPKLQE